MVDIQADVVLSNGVRRTVITQVAAGEPWGLRVADVVPQIQIDATDWRDVNARVTVTCDGGKQPCGLTVANWYYPFPIREGMGPSTYSVQPVCSPY